jgi:two-component system LytT family sensor kinase
MQWIWITYRYIYNTPEKVIPLHNFIFSDNIFYRVTRHLVFWIGVFLWFLLRGLGQYAAFLQGLFQTLPICILTTYITLYFLIPRYLLRKKYRTFLVVILILAILYPLIFIFNPIVYFIDHERFVLNYSTILDHVFDKQDLIVWKVGQWDAWGLTMTVSGFAAVIKLMKLFYLENSENKRLQEKKVNQELQLLKSQLNSRFLFDSLKSIQHRIQNQSPGSSNLILSLSDLLSYMLYENSEKSVRLNKEIEIIEDYLKLENESHGNTIDIKVTRLGEIGERQIVPLVLLPLVETCFEHSSARAKKGAGIFLDFDVRGLALSVTLKINNLRTFSQEVFEKSIRIKNVRHRLNSYYSGKHRLDIVEDNQNYIVRLELAL